MDAVTVGFISAATALATAVISPFVTLRVSRRQMHAAVISVNRQKWIDELRSSVAEFAAQIAVFEKVRQQSLGGGQFSSGERESLANRFEKAATTAVKINLLIDPNNETHIGLINTLDRIVAVIASLDPSRTEVPDFRNDIVTLIKLARSIIREEWRLMKSYS